MTSNDSESSVFTFMTCFHPSVHCSYPFQISSWDSCKLWRTASNSCRICLLHLSFLCIHVRNLKLCIAQKPQDGKNCGTAWYSHVRIKLRYQWMHVCAKLPGKKTWLSKNKTNSYRIPLCSVSMFINHPKVDTVLGPLASHFGIACSALMPPRWLILLSSLHHSVDRDFQMIVPLVWSRWQ